MRLALTLAAIVLGLTVVAAVMFGGPKTQAPPDGTEQGVAGTQQPEADDADDSAQDTEDGETPDPADDATDDGSDSDPDSPEDPGTTPDDEATDPEAADSGDNAAPAEEATLRARFVEADGTAITPITIGGLDDPETYKLEATLSPYRAGLLEVRLTDYFEQVDQVEHYTLVTPINAGDEDAPLVGSYAARAVHINGQRIPLYARGDDGGWIAGWEIAEQSASSVTFRLTIESVVDEVATPIAEITRVYHLDEGSYSIQLDQSVRNLSDEGITVQWEQLGQGDITWDRGDYLRGRSRQYVLGYFNLEHDPQRFSISARDGYIFRDDAIKKIVGGDWDSVWPNTTIDPEQKELAWLASVNRYFAVVTSAHVDPDATDSAQVPALDTVYPEIGTELDPSAEKDPDASADERAVMFTLQSTELTIEPGASTKPVDLGLDIFAGPRKQAVFDDDPYAPMRFNHLIRYSLGGMCGFCTFQWLADGLMGLLRLFHAMLFDWGVAIILLVLIVRLCLHPITKRGQINMIKMGKQMAAVQPDIQKLKKKYADNPQKMQQEQMQLFREKGINPAAGALGCLPMFLQMPIWIALYAMLYYAIELRHEPAFFNVFQEMGSLVGLNWNFLSDLSRSDHFITFFSEPRTLNLLFIRFDYSGLNVLPLLMAVTFYINMKFTTPPPANEQQAQQQKIMRLMPFFFPIMLYSAPSGLTLYICASTAAGILDSYIARKHIKQLEAEGRLFEKKERKPGGIMHRLQMAAQQAQEAQQQKAQGGKGGGKPDQNRGPQNYKKRKR